MNERLGNVGEAMIRDTPPGQRFDMMPRPLKYVKVRLYPDGAKWLKELIRDEQEELMVELGRHRKAGLEEGDEVIQEVRGELAMAAQIIKDIDLGQIEFAGGQEG